MKFGLFSLAVFTAIFVTTTANGYGYDKPKAPEYPKPEYRKPEYKTPEYKKPEPEAPKYEAPKYEAPKYEAPKYEPPKYEPPKHEHKDGKVHHGYGHPHHKSKYTYQRFCREWDTVVEQEPSFKTKIKNDGKEGKIEVTCNSKISTRCDACCQAWGFFEEKHVHEVVGFIYENDKFNHDAKCHCLKIKCKKPEHHNHHHHHHHHDKSDSDSKSDEHSHSHSHEHHDHHHKDHHHHGHKDHHHHHGHGHDHKHHHHHHHSDKKD